MPFIENDMIIDENLEKEKPLMDINQSRMKLSFPTFRKIQKYRNKYE